MKRLGQNTGNAEDLLNDPAISNDESLKFGGSRGAAAFAREMSRWETHPEEALYAVDKSARSMVGARPGTPFRLGDVIGSLPFMTYLTKKRAFGLLCEVGEAQLQGDHNLAMGLVGQGLRWLALSLALKEEEEAAWRKPDLFTGHLQDVRQLTALCGLLRDEDSLQLRLHKAGGKGHGKNKDKKDGE